jgi:hypothetical protein
MNIIDLELLIYEQAMRNYGLHLERCRRRVAQAQSDMLDAEDEYKNMLNRYEAARSRLLNR